MRNPIEAFSSDCPLAAGAMTSMIGAGGAITSMIIAIAAAGANIIISGIIIIDANANIIISDMIDASAVLTAPTAQIKEAPRAGMPFTGHKDRLLYEAYTSSDRQATN
jgi:hypothetical protein